MAKMAMPEIDDALRDLRGWQKDGDALKREYTYPDHITAMGFVVRVAMSAEKMDHHPELTILYNKVSLRLWTHTEGGVTKNDVELAKAIDKVA